MKWQQPAKVHELEQNKRPRISKETGRPDTQVEVASLVPQHLDKDSTFSVNLIRDALLKASKLNARIIYIENEKDLLRVRFRLRGVLTEELLTTSQRFDSHPFLQAITSDKTGYADRDTTVSATINGLLHEITLLPLIDISGNQNLTIKLRPAPRFAPTLDELGIPVHLLRQLRAILDSQHGLFIICSSDSHNAAITRQAVLQYLNSPARKIIDVDSVQHHKLPRITSLLLPGRDDNAKNLSCKLLDHEPDVVGLGANTDYSLLRTFTDALTRRVTLVAGIKADTALSGIRHWLSQVNPAQATSAFSGVLAQQTLSRVCPDCKAPHRLSDDEIHWVNTHFPGTVIPEGQLVEGEGCESCYDTGTSGTYQVWELVKADEEMRVALEKRDLDAVTTALVLQDQFESIRSRAFKAALRGEVSLSQVMHLK